MNKKHTLTLADNHMRSSSRKIKKEFFTQINALLNREEIVGVHCETRTINKGWGSSGQASLIAGVIMMDDGTIFGTV